MRLHLVALPHTRVEPAFSGCAYTGKALKFCKMMGGHHEIILYAPEGDPPAGVTLVPCLTNDERTKIFGQDDPNRLPDWPTDEQSIIFNVNVIKALHERVDVGRDIVLLTAGRTHDLIKRAMPKMLVAEPGVGYAGILDNSHCAFESYAWMHAVYAKRGIKDIRWFDAVIPPYCDPDEFPHLNDGKGKYLLFLGRLIHRKGPHIAIDIAKRCGLPLYVAGAGGKSELTLSGLTKIKGVDVDISGDLKHIGPVDVEARAKLLAGAKALICPTTYLEPGGNVAIEAMLAGTPVITADFGVFSETVRDGVSGFHFRMPREGVAAVGKTGNLSPMQIRDYAISRYSLGAVAPQFDRWFERLSTLFGDGWNT